MVCVLPLWLILALLIGSTPFPAITTVSVCHGPDGLRLSYLADNETFFQNNCEWGVCASVFALFARRLGRGGSNVTPCTRPVLQDVQLGPPVRCLQTLSATRTCGTKVGAVKGAAAAVSLSVAA
jgi:hypothetical protein